MFLLLGESFRDLLENREIFLRIKLITLSSEDWSSMIYIGYVASKATMYT